MVKVISFLDKKGRVRKKVIVSGRVFSVKGKTRKEMLIDKIIELEKKLVPTRKELRQLRVEELKEWLRELKEEVEMMKGEGEKFLDD